MRTRNVPLLAISQSLGMSGAPIVVLLGGIVGSELAPTPSLATLPISLMVVGVAMFAIPASLVMRKIGRRRGFMAATLVAGLAALLAAYAIARGSFFLFCLAILGIGANSAFIQQYRFAAAESVSPRYAARVVSLVLVGGMLAGFLGPEIAKRSQDWLAAGTYTGSFVALAGLYFLVAILLSFLIDVAPQEVETGGAGRSLRTIVSQPGYLVAVLAGAVAYGVMSFIMTATPVHLHKAQGYSLGQTAWVIQSHIIAMYFPSLFSGIVLERLGTLRTMVVGVLAMTACVALGTISRELLHFWGALVLLGVGWNFMFVGSTLLLTQNYLPAERFKAQATNDFTIFGVQALSSLSSGAMLAYASWDTLNLMTLPFLLLTMAAILLLRRQHSLRSPAPSRA